MSQSGWYHDKASECNRMALASRSAAARDRHIKDRDNWREIAARIDAAEETIKQRKRKEGPSGGACRIELGRVSTRPVGWCSFAKWPQK
jgi:hypothetical protein